MGKPEIRFKGYTDEWEQRKLKDIIEYIVDNRGKNPPYYCSEGIPVIDNFMIQNTLYPDLQTATRFIDSALYNDFIRKYNEEDDTLLTLVGNGIGNITLFPKEKAVIIQNTLGFRAKKNRKFLFFLLMANNEKLLKLDRGMAQPSIRQDEILDIDIHVPSESEQTEIGKYFTSIDNLITLHQRKPISHLNHSTTHTKHKGEEKYVRIRVNDREKINRTANLRRFPVDIPGGFKDGGGSVGEFQIYSGAE